MFRRQLFMQSSEIDVKARKLFQLIKITIQFYEAGSCWNLKRSWHKVRLKSFADKKFHHLWLSILELNKTKATKPWRNIFRNFLNQFLLFITAKYSWMALEALKSEKSFWRFFKIILSLPSLYLLALLQLLPRTSLRLHLCLHKTFKGMKPKTCYCHVKNVLNRNASIVTDVIECWVKIEINFMIFHFKFFSWRPNSSRLSFHNVLHATTAYS